MNYNDAKEGSVPEERLKSAGIIRDRSQITWAVIPATKLQHISRAISVGRQVLDGSASASGHSDFDGNGSLARGLSSLVPESVVVPTADLSKGKGADDSRVDI